MREEKRVENENRRVGKMKEEKRSERREDCCVYIYLY